MTNKNLMDGVSLKAWRRRRGLTQKQAAALLEIPALTISGWETGRLQIKRPRMLALALRTVAADLAK